MPASTAPPPAAPPKPAADPPAPPPPSPSAGQPAPLADKARSEYMADVEADLDALDAAEEAKVSGKPAPQKPKPATKPENEEGTVVKPPEGEKKGEGEEAAGAKKPDEPPAPTKLNDLRTAYDNIKKEVKEKHLPTIQRLEARVKELESATPPEVSVLQERLTAAERRRDELEKEISYVDYTKSKEYREKYQQPFEDAWKDANADLAELEVELPDGNKRQATQEDLVQLANMKLGPAIKLANELFGDAAPAVLAHRQKVIDLSKAQQKAIEDAKTRGTERTTQTEQQRNQASETAQKLWKESNAEIVTKWPKMFGQVEGDTEGNALLDKGLALADRLFVPTEESRPKTVEEATRLHAIMRNKIANHDRLAHWLKQARAKIKEMEETIKQFEGSEPPGGDGGQPGNRAPNGDFLESANQEIDALDRKGR